MAITQQTDTKTEISPPSRRNTFRELFAATDAIGMPRAFWRARGKKAGTNRPYPIIVLPGLGAGDSSTIPLRYFLSRYGYQTEGWALGVNTGGRGLISELSELSGRWDVDRTRKSNGEGDVPALCDKMTDRVIDRSQALGKPVILIGWSLGGYVAREAARDLPEQVAAVITLGSPVIGGPKYTAAAGLYKSRNVDMDWIEAEIEKRSKAVPITQPITAVYSKRDGVVAWEAMIDKHSPDVTHIEVNASHLGIGMNAKVWDIVLKTLENLETKATL